MRLFPPTLLSIPLLAAIVLTSGPAHAVCNAMKVVSKKNEANLQIRVGEELVSLGTVVHLMQTSANRYRLDFEGGKAANVDGPLDLFADGKKVGSSLSGPLNLDSLSEHLAAHRVRHGRADPGPHPDHGAATMTEEARRLHAAQHAAGIAHNHSHEH